LQAIITFVVSNIEFTAYLKALAEQNDVTLWDSKRERFISLQRNLSYLAYGLIPAEFSRKDFFGNMFLHGSLNHLLGNMLFLFVALR
jgi:membrane associated rhomboid family serine protease